MLKTNFINQKESLRLIQKAIMTGIGATVSQERIKKVAYGIYDDIQKMVLDLVKDLEKKGEIKTQETKAIIKDLQKKSESEKAKIYKRLQKEGKSLIGLTKEIMLIPGTIMKEITSTLSSSSKLTIRNGANHRAAKKKSSKKSRKKR